MHPRCMLELSWRVQRICNDQPMSLADFCGQCFQRWPCSHDLGADHTDGSCTQSKLGKDLRPVTDLPQQAAGADSFWHHNGVAGHKLERLKAASPDSTMHLFAQDSAIGTYY